MQTGSGLSPNSERTKLEFTEKVDYRPPPLRLGRGTWGQQRVVVQDLQQILDRLGIYHFNPMDYVDQNNFLARDRVHYLPYAEKIVSEQAAEHLKVFMTTRWGTPHSNEQ